MSFNSSRNTAGNYELEQYAHKHYFDLVTTVNGAQGRPPTVHLPGNGLLSGRMGSRDLAVNHADIESRLFGIGATNLVHPQPKIIPELITLQSLNMSDRIPMVLPDPVILEPNRRINHRS